MNIVRFFFTIRFLKPIQVFYQVKYRFVKPKTLVAYRSESEWTSTSQLDFFPLPSQAPVLKMMEEDGFSFTFLNLEKTFGPTIDWTEDAYGKLWNYNLQYLDFLRQNDIPETVKNGILSDLYGWLEKGDLLLEPYPVSLRIMNVIRYLKDTTIEEPRIIQCLFAETAFLSNRLEYHLLGNHLLENGFALLMSGYFFNHREWILKAEKLLTKELDEQVLEDGAHFELSPMYHQIILFRVLEAVRYLPKDSDMGIHCRGMALKMMAWLGNISFFDGTVPHFNDSTNGIAFTPGELNEMAGNLGLGTVPKKKLSASGYRKLSNGIFELIADIHGISPNYQPGHAHADHLSFVLQVKGSPFIVDLGISTYQIGNRRSFERSTKAHNTVTLEDQNTSEVWSGFRVAKRANVMVKESDKEKVVGILKFGKLVHTRTIEFLDHELIIEDEINLKKPAVLRFYFHPDIDIDWIDGDKALLSNGMGIQCAGAKSIRPMPYLYNLGFNLQVPAKGLEISFHKNCKSYFGFNP